MIQRVLAAGTKVFANPLTSYNHKDDLLDIVTALGLEHTGTIAIIHAHRGHPSLPCQPP